ncbi:MAG TPA: 50S ribosomal protein L2, partial [Nitrososphaera sp.]
MGKRTLVRRRGHAGKQFRAIIVGKIAPAKYPNFKLEENHKGTVVDIIHERGRDAPLAKVFFDDGRYSYVPAPEGTTVGSIIPAGQGSKAERGNILALESIPDGTPVCN